MRPCDCTNRHPKRRVVLTGGPGAGKTAVLELVRQALCRHVVVLPEAAGTIFKGGFPRDALPEIRRAAQRAIYHLQLELETAVAARGPAVALCDRGIVDGIAYWPGPDDFWTAVGTTHEASLKRYHAVIHLRVPDSANGYGNSNPLRIESAAEARAIDDRILDAWQGHPRRHIIEPTTDFLSKATRALGRLQAELPPCCHAAMHGSSAP